MKTFYPAWIPYPSSLFRSVIAALVLSVLVLCLRITGFVGLFLSALTDKQDLLFIMLVSGFLVPFLLITYAHHVLFGKESPKRPSWIPGFSSWREGFSCMSVILVATITAALAIAPTVKCYSYSDVFRCADPTEPQLQAVITIWFVAAAYLYQADFLIRRWLKRRFQRSGTSTNH